MIIWQGYGFLAVIIPLLTALILPFIGLHKLGIGVIIGAILVAYIGYKLNNIPGRELIDAKTNETVVLRKKHTLFWIPMQYIAVLWFIVGIALMIIQSK